MAVARYSSQFPETRPNRRGFVSHVDVLSDLRPPTTVLLGSFHILMSRPLPFFNPAHSCVGRTTQPGHGVSRTNSAGPITTTTPTLPTITSSHSVTGSTAPITKDEKTRPSLVFGFTSS